ncbi:MAG: glycerophosphodiester phosphodiesterase [Bacteroidetes bacterium QH_7_62_13]|nr:MAG: glycerophosphodiester phosphodiesterase [Bacteroidetes bacterium QH_7_62_13]
MSAAYSTPSEDTSRAPNRFDLQGHRGARGLAPENTIPAFRRALEIGVATLEMDVVVAGDGTVVVSHEPWMASEKCVSPDGDRIADVDRHNIYEMAYDDVATYDCGSQQLKNFPEQEPQAARKPRLRDVIRMAEAYTRDHNRGPVFYNIEVKSRPEWDGTYHPKPRGFVERVLTAVTEAGVASRTTIQSFDVRSLEHVHRLNAPVRTAFLVGWAANDGGAENVEALSFLPDIYSPDVRLVDENLVTTLRARGVQLIPWTVNEIDAMKRLLRLGVDGFITDYPNRGRAVLDEYTAK